MIDSKPSSKEERDDPERTKPDRAGSASKYVFGAVELASSVSVSRDFLYTRIVWSSTFYSRDSPPIDMETRTSLAPFFLAGEKETLVVARSPSFFFCPRGNSILNVLFSTIILLLSECFQILLKQERCLNLFK